MEAKERGSYFDITPILKELDVTNGVLYDTAGFFPSEKESELKNKKKELRSELKRRFELELTAMGLSVEENSHYHALDIKIVNLDQFIDYLKKINTGNPSETQINGIKKVIENSYNHIIFNAEFESDEGSADILIDFVSSIDGFKEQCEKLDPDGSNGVSKKAKKISEIIEIAKHGYLSEYLLGEELLYGPEDNYGITNIHKPMLDGSFIHSEDPEGPIRSTKEVLKDSLDNYKRIWDDALYTVRKIKNGGNEKAKNLLVKIFSNLKASIDYIEDDVYNSSPLYYEAKDFLSDLMRDVRKKLEDLERS